MHAKPGTLARLGPRVGSEVKAVHSNYDSCMRAILFILQRTSVSNIFYLNNACG